MKPATSTDPQEWTNCCSLQYRSGAAFKQKFMELETVGATERFSVSIRGLAVNARAFPGAESARDSGTH